METYEKTFDILVNMTDEELDLHVERLLNIEKMTDEEKEVFNQVLDQELGKQPRSVNQVELRESVIALFQPPSKGARRYVINFSVKTVAIAINVAIATALFFAGGALAGLKALIKRKGKVAAKRILSSAVRNAVRKILGNKIALQAAGLAGAIVNTLMDPGTYIANFIDKNWDRKRNSGRIEF